MYTHHFNSCECASPDENSPGEKKPDNILTRYLFTQSPFECLLAPRVILNSFPGIYYVTPKDNSVVLCVSSNYHERDHGTWTELPPMAAEGGLLVHWMVKTQCLIPSESGTDDGLTRNRFRELRTTENDEKFVELCESWGWDVAGPSYEGSFLVLDTIGKAWIFSGVDLGPVWGRNVVEALWTAYNVAYMNRRVYPLPWEEERPLGRV
jgi:hypothetical protein